MALDPFTAGFELLKTGLSKWIPDANVREEAAREMSAQLNLQVIGQLEINKEEAKSDSLFVAGWRPFIGWVCGGAYAYSFVIQPFLIFAVAVVGVHVDHTKLPHLDWSELGFVLAGILGLGYFRTHEKKLGVA